jgi:hypothetical protein
MWKNSKWKMVAGAATLSALGISGLALADPSSSGVPDSIELSDQVSVSGKVPTTLPDFVRGVGVSGDPDDLDSPFDDTGTGDTASVTGDTPDGLDTLTGDSEESAGTDSVSPEVVPSPTVPAPTFDDSDSVSVGGDSADFSSAS